MLLGAYSQNALLCLPAPLQGAVAQQLILWTFTRVSNWDLTCGKARDDVVAIPVAHGHGGLEHVVGVPGVV